MDDLVKVELPTPPDPPVEASPEAAFIADAPTRLGLALARLESATIMLPLLQRRVLLLVLLVLLLGWISWLRSSIFLVTMSESIRTEKEIDEEEELEMKRKRGL